MKVPWPNSCYLTISAGNYPSNSAGMDYRRESLEPYTARLACHFGNKIIKIPSASLSSGILRLIGARLVSGSWFARRIVLDRWFLHADHQALPAAPVQAKA